MEPMEASERPFAAVRTLSCCHVTVQWIPRKWHLGEERNSNNRTTVAKRLTGEYDAYETGGGYEMTFRDKRSSSYRTPVAKRSENVT